MIKLGTVSYVLFEFGLARVRLLHQGSVLCSLVALRQQSILSRLHLLLQFFKSAFVLVLNHKLQKTIPKQEHSTNLELFLEPLEIIRVLVANILDGDRHGLLVGVLHVERLLEQGALVLASFLDLDIFHSQLSVVFLPESCS